MGERFSSYAVVLSLLVAGCAAKAPPVTTVVIAGVAPPPATPPPDGDEPGQGKTSPGRLPPAIIQAIVRAQFNGFRDCYEAGLLRDPALKGQVRVRFVIGRDGSVLHVKEEIGSKDAFNPGGKQSTPAPPVVRMPDAEVTRCVLGKFQELIFPQPEGGLVKVTYPIMFAPGD